MKAKNGSIRKTTNGKWRVFVRDDNGNPVERVDFSTRKQALAHLGVKERSG